MANSHPKQRFFVATVPFDEGEKISNGPQRQVVDFQLKTIKPGDSKVNCDLYFNNRWLRRLAFDLQVADSA